MWQINSAHKFIEENFDSLSKVFLLSGQKVSQSSISDVIFLIDPIQQKKYFIKRFYAGGKKLRRYVGTSRIKRDWQNLQFFQSLGIPTPTLIAHGEQKKLGIFKRGAMVTEGVAQALDLQHIAKNHPELFENPTWRKTVLQKIGEYLRRIHQQKFIHRDLKFRNILVTLTPNPEVFWFDCPSGKKHYLFLKKKIKKDLAILKKSAEKYLSKEDWAWLLKCYEKTSE